MKKRIFSLILAAAMVLTCSATAETTKHEHLFAVVSSDGTAQTIIDSVHLENADGMDTIADKTILTDIENVSGHEAFTLDGEMLTWEAGGKDITYQGHGVAELPVSPVVAYELDGSSISADDLTGKSGKLTVTVSYAQAKRLPMLAVSAMLLDEEHFSNVTAENATLISDGSRTLLVGWAVPGMLQELALPEHFSFSCDCTDVDLSLMYTVATAAPLRALVDEKGSVATDGRTLTELIANCLTALTEGTDMPEGDTEIVDIFSSLATLKTGAMQLSEGTAALETGLTTLADNNDTLNQGATQLFAAVLQTANAQLSAAGLDAAGITLPELTAENYHDVLQGVLEQLTPEALQAKVEASARDTVRTQVMAQEDAIRAAVNQAVEAKVLEGVLSALKPDMDAETYAAAVKAGKVTEEQTAQINGAVSQQMTTDEVKAQAEAAFQEQVNQLVEQNFRSEEVQAQVTAALEAAQSTATDAYEALSALQKQLDDVHSFVTGLAQYTAGVSSASEGAAQVAAGSATLSTGVSDGLTKISDKLLPLLTGDVTKALDGLDTIKSDLEENISYDLIPEEMSTDLLIVIRSQLNQ